METRETAMARELFHQITQTWHGMRTGLGEVLSRAPSCHFDMLHRLHDVTRQYGREDTVAVAELNRRMYDSPQAVSRALRVLEKDGLIQRTTDPDDRRKTLVRMTETGRRDHDICEKAVTEYALSVARRMGPEALGRFIQDWALFAQAVEAENEARRAREKE